LELCIEEDSGLKGGIVVVHAGIENHVALEEQEPEHMMTMRNVLEDGTVDST
tara:strand:+ start:482 stop:637 length:156 start_codon:yes stop_codon:yes gene_type:complete